MNREIRKLTKKVDDLQKQLNQQNEYIMDQSLIIQKLIEKLVVIPSNPRFLDERFTGTVQHDKWQPYKGPDCENRTTTPITHTSYDGTKSTLPVTVPEKWTATQVYDFMWKNRHNF
jgi:hypothetical protein